jgi:hypothetical protein
MNSDIHYAKLTIGLHRRRYEIYGIYFALECKKASSDISKVDNNQVHTFSAMDIKFLNAKQHGI